MRLVTLTTLYPNSIEPRHGIFIETRLREYLKAYPDTQARVIAPVPWFPFAGDHFGSYGRLARVPASETLHGIEIQHPRYPVIPKIGMLLAPFTLAWCMWRALRALRASGFDYDVVDAHYYFPDGVSAVWAAGRLRRPCVVSARGSDLTVIAKMPIPRRMIRWASRMVSHSITVSEALRNVLRDLGQPPARVTTLRNGVDLELFRPAPERNAHNGRPYALCVGHLNDNKGQHLVLDALANTDELAGLDVVLAGDGPRRGALEAQVEHLGLRERVRFLGTVRQRELVTLYGNAAMLVLASATEGWPNVLLESMACGTPVVATRTWGIPEIVRAPEAGVLVERNVQDIGRGMLALLVAPPDRAATRAYAQHYSWDDTVCGMHALFEAACAAADSSAATG